MLKITRLLALLLGGSALGMTTAHVLELPQKLRFDDDLYARVNGNLYRTFALVGGPLQISSVLAGTALAWASRRRQRRAAFRWAAAGAGILAAGFASWLALVAPVNARVARNPPEDRPRVWRDNRSRWEYGHVIGFVFQLVGFGALAWSALDEDRLHFDARRSRPRPSARNLFTPERARPESPPPSILD